MISKNQVYCFIYTILFSVVSTLVMKSQSRPCAFNYAPTTKWRRQVEKESRRVFFSYEKRGAGRKKNVFYEIPKAFLGIGTVASFLVLQPFFVQCVRTAVVRAPAKQDQTTIPNQLSRSLNELVKSKLYIVHNYQVLSGDPKVVQCKYPKGYPYREMVYF